MSTNVSLTNAGTSINFDGQALQNQQEVEMEREEQLQQSELRQLLSNAFDDLDDDILSVASSDEDSVNTSHMSSHHHDMSSHPDSMQAERTVNSAGSGVISSAPVVPASAGLTSYTPSRLHPLRTSQEGSVGASHNSPAPSQPSSFSWAQQQQQQQQPLSEGHHQWMGGEGVGDQEQDHVWGVVRTGEGCGGGLGGDVGEEPQRDVVDGSQLPSLPHRVPASSAAFPQPIGYTATTTAATTATAVAAGDSSSLPYSHGPSAHFHHPGGAGQYWGHAGHDGFEPPASGYHRHFPFGSAGGLDPQQYNSDSVTTFTHTATPTTQGWSTSQSKDFATDDASYPEPHHHHHPVLFPLQSSAGTQGKMEDAYPEYSPYPYADAGPVGWGRAVTSSSDHGVDSSSTTTAPYPIYSAPGPGRMGREEVNHQQGAAQSSQEEVGESFDHYTVTYKKRQHSAQPASSSSGTGDLKVNFIMQEGDNEESTRLSQLRVLYEARGRQLEDLRVELDKVTQESAKERRMLKHLLSVATGEKEGMEKSLKQSQQLLAEVREEQSQTATQFQTSQAQLKAMRDSKEELVKQLQSAETTIETLSHQVAGLQGADSLSQARHQHEAVVSSLQQRFDAQILHLKQQLDQANESLSLKAGEVSRLQDQVREQTRKGEEAHISRGETINQLTRSLEESQQRCQALLSASSGEESSKLRAQLQQSLMAKKMSDDMCSSLQAEVQELKEQLHLLESATSLGALSSSSAAASHSDAAVINDSMADLGIRKTLDFSTPECSARYDGSLTSEELVGKLRRELERCVVSNRQKRQQVGDLQQTTRQLTQDLDLLRQQLEGAQQTVRTQQVKLTSYEERLGGSLQPSAVESRLKRDLDNLQLENKALIKDAEDYKARLNELSANEEQLTQINEQLKQQMAAMVTQHDQDMREAVDRCRQGCENVHKVALQKQEHRLRCELFADKQEYLMKYEGQLATSREEVQTLQEELDKVKDLYVQASRDLTHKEEQLCSKDSDLQDAIAAEKKKWESEREVAMETVWQQRLQKARSEWEAQKEAETQDDWRRGLDAERQKWESENQQRAEKDWQQRLETERAAWEAQREAEAEPSWQRRLDSARQQWESQKRGEAERDLEQRLEQGRQEWESQKAEEWQQRLEEERQSWESEKQAAPTDEEWKRRLEEERQSWELERAAEWKARLEQELQAAEAERRKAAEAEWKARLEKEKRSWQVGADREVLEQSDLAVASARRKWQQETQEELTRLTERLGACRAQHQAELAAMETKWRREAEERGRGMEERLQRALEAEAQVGERLGREREELKEEARRSLQEERCHKEELAQRLKEEGERVSAETRQQVEAEKEAAVERARHLWQTEHQEGADRNVQEVARWKEQFQRLQGELARQTETLGAERGRLLSEKDEERRQAVSKARSECQADCQRLMEESRATLDSALDSARKHHQRQLDEVEARYKEELSALRTVEQELRQALSLASADGQQESNTQGPAPSDPSGTSGTSSSHSQQQREAEQRWRREGERLRKEVEKREQLLRQADHHMEQEVQRLRDSLAEGYSKQREKDTQRLQAQYSQAMQINQKERSRLERQVELLEQRLHNSLQPSNNNAAGTTATEEEEEEEGLNSVRDDRDRLAAEVRALQEERDRLEDALRAEEEEAKKRQQQEDAHRRHLQEAAAAERDTLAQRLKESQAALRALAQEKERQGLQQQRLEQARVRTQQLEGALKAVARQHRQDLEAVHEAHQEKVDALTAHLSQVQKQHSATLEELQEQHKELVERLEERHRAEQLSLAQDLERKHQAETQSLVEEVRRQARRALTHTPTQTESDDSVYVLKDQYLTAVQNIKEEVMSHIGMSNERAATAMKVEIRRERHRTIQHLRGRCKSRLRHLLQGNVERYRGNFLYQTQFRLQNPDVWGLIDQALDSLFDSVSSSRSATPSTSNPITPRSSEEDDDTAPPHPPPPHTSAAEGGERDRGRRDGGVGNTSLGSTRLSTPGSERYALPASLGEMNNHHHRSHGSLEELHGSGVYYSLLPDDTASVTDSELEFKVPQAVRRAVGRRSAFHAAQPTSAAASAESSGQRSRRSATPPKVKTDLSVFAGNKGDDDKATTSPILLSPKLLHREKEGGSCLEGEGRDPRRQLRFTSRSLLDSVATATTTTTDSDASFTSGGGDPDPEPRRPLPRHHDSDDGGEGHRSSSKVKVRPPGMLSRSQDFTGVREKSLSLSLRQENAGAGGGHAARERSVSGGKTQPKPSERSPQPASRRSHNHLPGRSSSVTSSSHQELGIRDRGRSTAMTSSNTATPPGRGKSLPSRRSPQPPLSLPPDVHGTTTPTSRPRSSQHASAERSQQAQLGKAATTSSKLLLNPRDFLSGSGKKLFPTAPHESRLNTSSHGASGEGLEKDLGEGVLDISTGLETLHSMLEKLGISAPNAAAASSSSHHTHSHHSQSAPRKKTSFAGREGAVPDSAATTQKAPAGKAKTQDSHKSKTRTRSADDTSFGSDPGSCWAKLSVFSPRQASQEPVFRGTRRQGRRRGGEREEVVVRRSLEDLPTHYYRGDDDDDEEDLPSSLGLGVGGRSGGGGRVRWKSEQALHVLSEALGEVVKGLKRLCRAIAWEMVKTPVMPSPGLLTYASFAPRGRHGYLSFPFIFQRLTGAYFVVETRCVFVIKSDLMYVVLKT
ncbi:uncharacterized protein LOC143277792 [Babylonia areolata]|uniref:uncharacterized protein LOC143277792 n=1 Tax=Babylonia areolata TaxID=304850 RepID=UPI003FD08BB9